jgi:hypothetical protein
VLPGFPEQQGHTVRLTDRLHRRCGFRIVAATGECRWQTPDDIVYRRLVQRILVDRGFRNQLEAGGLKAAITACSF